ncbi:MAG: apolipoprotein N-acyltransferase [Pseudomonadota bacterium]|nr:apolipoprotein N-acyltransferase [Pseudomonadota bacterium]
MKNKIILLTERRYFGILLFFFGLLSSLGYAPFHLFPLTILSYLLAIYVFILSNRSNIHIFYFGFIFSLGSHLGLLYWIAISFKTANMGGYFAGSIAVLLLCCFLSCFTALSFYFLFKYFKHKKGLIFGTAFTFIFSFFDWAKGNILWGFPWTPISSIWSFSSVTLYPFSVFGVWGYSLITYLFIISLYYLFFSFRKFSLFIFPIIFSILFLPKIINSPEENTGEINVRIVQPNIKQEDKWSKDKIKENYEKLTNLINTEYDESFDLIILPETAVSFDIIELAKKNRLQNFGLDHTENLILGDIRREEKTGSITIFNSMFLINNNFEKVYYHDKLKLVPFGEFMPLRKFFGLEKLSPGSLDFTSGKNASYLTLASNIKILPLICYEVIFPHLVKSISGEYNLIVNITNDAWYKKSSGPYQHFSLSKIRAVMEGTSMIRSANTGISGIIGSDGNILAKLDLEQEGVVDYKLNLRSIKTVYNNYGNSLFILIMLTLLFVICNSVFYRKNKS